ncbi:helix-turn-helix domain-containing protein [Nocardia sp. NRRL S-836]|uniref:helix-turn-helix domain-containing protein n=1 Tax=Nocardia sp. NRRL S-836 TaxID=1519492 RepID=UPI0006AF40EA|nr:helix-turn-helix transcriptional regulator [Nocardia sp. NRRL S-836]KOV79931.1 DNA-binding protein [Nocardia sp. NRRL S-836]
MADIFDFKGKREPQPLWREALGRKLREIRERQGARLVDVAERAGISTQYLSEIERGRKEPSSEMIAAVTGALGVDLADLLVGIAGQVRHFQTARTVNRPGGPVLTRRPVSRPDGPVLMAA